MVEIRDPFGRRYRSVYRRAPNTLRNEIAIFLSNMPSGTSLVVRFPLHRRAYLTACKDTRNTYTILYSYSVFHVTRVRLDQSFFPSKLWTHPNLLAFLETLIFQLNYIQRGANYLYGSLILPCWIRARYITEFPLPVYSGRAFSPTAY